MAMVLTGWQGGCEEGVWANHCSLTLQPPRPAPYTLTHALIMYPFSPLLAHNRHLEAEPLYRLALEQQQRVLGPEHPDTIWSINNLAACIYTKGRWAGSDAAECGWG